MKCKGKLHRRTVHGATRTTSAGLRGYERGPARRERAGSAASPQPGLVNLFSAFRVRPAAYHYLEAVFEDRYVSWQGTHTLRERDAEALARPIHQLHLTSTLEVGMVLRRSRTPQLDVGPPD